jgi:hypothetical protein
MLLVIGWNRLGLACENEKICCPTANLSQFCEILQAAIAVIPRALAMGVKSARGPKLLSTV